MHCRSVAFLRHFPVLKYPAFIGALLTKWIRPINWRFVFKCMAAWAAWKLKCLHARIFAPVITQLQGIAVVTNALCRPVPIQLCFIQRVSKLYPAGKKAALTWIHLRGSPTPANPWDVLRRLHKPVCLALCIAA